MHSAYTQHNRHRNKSYLSIKYNRLNIVYLPVHNRLHSLHDGSEERKRKKCIFFCLCLFLVYARRIQLGALNQSIPKHLTQAYTLNCVQATTTIEKQIRKQHQLCERENRIRVYGGEKRVTSKDRARGTE